MAQITKTKIKQVTIMTEQDKQLLLIDLSARLPYGVKIQSVKEPDTVFRLCAVDIESKEIKFFKYEGKALTILDIGLLVRFNNKICYKPYLRPMSSMTEEEKEDLLEAVVGKDGAKYFQVLSDGSIDNTDATIQDLNKFNMHWIIFDKDTVTLYLDWLNAHYFDYRGLIEKGLALEAPEGMYELQEN